MTHLSSVKDLDAAYRYKGSTMHRHSLALILILVGNMFAPLAIADGALEPARRSEIIGLVQQDCGSCHGLTLKGGLGPALTREALAKQEPQMLRATISNGRPGTPMPPWRDFLSDAEITWVVDALMQGKIAGAK